MCLFNKLNYFPINWLNQATELFPNKLRNGEMLVILATVSQSQRPQWDSGVVVVVET